MPKIVAKDCIKRVTDHVGRFVEFSYTQQKLNGTPISNSRALLMTVLDVRSASGQVWTYDYYGQDTLENDSNKRDLLIRRLSPLVNTGGSTQELILEDLNYTLSGTSVTGLNQRRGAKNIVTPVFALETNFEFGLETTLDDQPQIQQTKTKIANLTQLTTNHYFDRGQPKGSANPLGNRTDTSINAQFRPTQQTKVKLHN
jgi:hypothetical protein